jgi:hypothetical protein
LENSTAIRAISRSYLRRKDTAQMTERPTPSAALIRGAVADASRSGGLTGQVADSGAVITHTATGVENGIAQTYLTFFCLDKRDKGGTRAPAQSSRSLLSTTST